jgi:DNA helicase-2/ATP-dependent DNA helicase PcrA
VEFVASEKPRVIAPTVSASGRRVRHAVFGAGKIVSESGSGDNKKITVIFDSGRRQTFMLRYAPLEML